MAFSINSNPLSLINQRELGKTTSELGKTSKKISSGKRLTDASVDPAALQMAAAQFADEKTLDVAIRNANDGISKLSIAEGALDTAGQIAGRMAELSTQAANGTLNNDQRAALNQEFQALKSELDRINSGTEFNGQSVFGETVLQTGTDGSEASQTSVNISAVSTSSLNLAAADISTADGAKAAMESSKNAISSIAATKAEIGSAESRLSTVISNNRTQQLGTTAARSQIEDADMAEETAKYTSLKIRQQMGAALSAQTNNLNAANVMRLLQG